MTVAEQKKSEALDLIELVVGLKIRRFPVRGRTGSTPVRGTTRIKSSSLAIIVAAEKMRLFRNLRHCSAIHFESLTLRPAFLRM